MSCPLIPYDSVVAVDSVDSVAVVNAAVVNEIERTRDQSCCHQLSNRHFDWRGAFP